MLLKSSEGIRLYSKTISNINFFLTGQRIYLRILKREAVNNVLNIIAQIRWNHLSLQNWHLKLKAFLLIFLVNSVNGLI